MNLLGLYSALVIGLLLVVMIQMDEQEVKGRSIGVVVLLPILFYTIYTIMGR